MVGSIAAECRQQHINSFVYVDNYKWCSLGVRDDDYFEFIKMYACYSHKQSRDMAYIGARSR